MCVKHVLLQHAFEYNLLIINFHASETVFFSKTIDNHKYFLMNKIIFFVIYQSVFPPEARSES